MSREQSSIQLWQSKEVLAKLQNTGLLIYILLNNNSVYCVILRSSKGFDTCKIGGPKWPCILLLLRSFGIQNVVLVCEASSEKRWNELGLPGVTNGGIKRLF